MVLMLLVVACYTVCGLSDKYSVAKLKFDGNSFTFLMALPTAVLLLPLMPFSDMHLQLCWQSVLAAVLIMVSKLLEFKMSALVLTEMSAFELKAWLGLCLFASYATDIITATDTFSVLKLLAIVVTAAGLFMIARSEREHISYKKIACRCSSICFQSSATALLSLRLRRTYPHTLPCFSDLSCLPPCLRLSFTR